MSVNTRMLDHTYSVVDQISHDDLRLKLVTH